MNSSLFVKQLGEGSRTLVFLPGITGTHRYWEERVANLAERKRLLLVDPLGFGQSEKPLDAIYSVDRHVEELRRALASEPPFTLVGHSMGAILAVAYAARYPEQVDRLHLLSLPCFDNRADAAAAMGFPYGLLYTNRFLAIAGCIAGRKLFGRFLTKIPAFLQLYPREVLEDVTTHHWQSFSSSLEEVIFNHDVKKDLRRLPKTLSVSFVHGDADQVAPLEPVRVACKERPEWMLHVLRGGDHHPLLRDPDWCLAPLFSS
ncbi:alpha/beta hydrolase [Brevibacillus ruminantium]|uniref:Alpha/beta hydrolase n=1 Tax=Brevibacillus ruminantium TaxID=2950604 RepID=A0ABY4WFG3_9BACL|nr:alpha/beta hydrolase [Brevibacillus ruminantium]USG65877.1 alpha/beta hydrolase [Brevibacillus ruminantium]